MFYFGGFSEFVFVCFFYLQLLLLLLERIFPSGPRCVAAIIKVIINDRYLHVLRLHGGPALRSAASSVSSVGAPLLLPPPLPPPPRVAHTGPARHRRKTGGRAGVAAVPQHKLKTTAVPSSFWFVLLKEAASISPLRPA